MRHKGVSSGHRHASEAFLRAQGAVFRIRHGALGGFARLLRDVPRRKSPFFKSVRYMIEGFLLAPRYFNPDGSDKL